MVLEEVVVNAIKILSEINDPEVALALNILSNLDEREREVITRLYVDAQQIGQICAEMNLTETEVRQIRSRVKSQFEELRRRHAEAVDQSLRKRAVQDMLAFAEQEGFKLGEGLEIRDLIHEGHRY